MEKNFISAQKERIIKRINKYKDKNRIGDELLSGDVSPYTRYKQKELVPILEKALKKIENGNYGICESCGQEIEEKRLLIVPAAEHCLKCIKKRPT